MARRKKVTSSEDCDVEARGRKDNKGKKRTNVIVPPRNRASPNAIVKLYDDLTVEQKDVIRNDMNQGSMLDIKCDQLHNPMLSWLTKLYNTKERAFVIPGHGKIPINEESVHVTMGLPRGPIEVPFYVNYDIEDGIAEELFPGDGSRPKMSRVGELLVQYQGVDDNFKRLWMVYVICTVLAPTTDIKISNKVYPMLVNIAEAGELNLCKFVVDYMHENLSRGKLNNACLLYAMLRYISSLNCEDYNLDLDGGDFFVNSWTRFAVETVAGLDQQDNDPYSFGKLEVVFIIYENLGDKTYSPHHWFVISLNMVAKRFEVLDSLRGENNQQLMNYAGRVISKIKEAWEVFYETAKNQIKEFTIKIIDVPRQSTLDDCGFFALNNAEKWNGELIPAMKADNVDKMKKIWPHRLLSSPMNATKLWRDHLKYNMV